MVRLKKIGLVVMGLMISLSLAVVSASAEPITDSEQAVNASDQTVENEVQGTENYNSEQEGEDTGISGENAEAETEEQEVKPYEWINIHGKLFYYVNGVQYNHQGWFKEKDIDSSADENNIYYFDEDSTAVTGWQIIDDNKYYFNENGIRQTGWCEVDGVKYYFDENGIMKKGWITVNNATYYMRDDGKVLTGKNYIEGNWYSFGAAGQLMIGRYYNAEGKPCYSNAKGIMAFDKWINIGEDKYYAKSDGTFATGKMILNGKLEEFDSDGKHIKTEDINVPYIYVKSLSVGNADCTFIKLPNGETALIDTGTPESAQKVVEFLNGQNLKKGNEKSKIDYILITHGHSDHIGGLRTILENFEIGKVYMPTIAKMKDWYSGIEETEDNKADLDMLKYDYEIYKDAEKAMEENNMEFTNTVKGQYMDSGNILKFIQSDAYFGPAGSDELTAQFWGINNNSAIVYLNYGDLQMLFAADIEWTAEHNFCFSNLLQGNKVDVLKVPHHGNDTSSTTEFLNVVNPQIGIMSRAQESITENIAYGNLINKGIRLYETSTTDGIDIYGTSENWTIN